MFGAPGRLDLTDLPLRAAPQVRVEPLHAACDTWCEFPVADRPDALRKWLATEDSRRGEWIAMIETDYVWKKALRMPPPGSSAVAFHFHYINPNYPTRPDVMRKLMPADRSQGVHVASDSPFNELADKSMACATRDRAAFEREVLGLAMQHQHPGLQLEPSLDDVVLAQHLPPSPPGTASEADTVSL